MWIIFLHTELPKITLFYLEGVRKCPRWFQIYLTFKKSIQAIQAKLCEFSYKLSRNFGTLIVWYCDLTFPWYPRFDRSFYPNLALYSFCILIFVSIFSSQIWRFSDISEQFRNPRRRIKDDGFLNVWRHFAWYDVIVDT